IPLSRALISPARDTTTALGGSPQILAAIATRALSTALLESRRVEGDILPAGSRAPVRGTRTGTLGELLVGTVRVGLAASALSGPGPRTVDALPVPPPPHRREQHADQHRDSEPQVMLDDRVGGRRQLRLGRTAGGGCDAGDDERPHDEPEGKRGHRQDQATCLHEQGADHHGGGEEHEIPRGNVVLPQPMTSPVSNTAVITSRGDQTGKRELELCGE